MKLLAWREQMKFIKYTEEAIETLAQQAYEDMKKKLKTDAVACHDRGKGKPAEVTPTIIFEPDAWEKAQALVELCDKEIAWHGIVERNSETSFTIKDVVVPPQTVTGTSVESDSNEWVLWASQLSFDEFNNMRCHMHSHVNMNVFSSGVDDDYQKDMVTKNGDLDYYLFLIFNKKGEVFARIYDVQKNIMYEDEEIEVIGYANEAKDWAQEQIANQVTTKKVTYGYGRGQMSIKDYGNWRDFSDD